jgi:hypothetical protein
MAGMILPPVNGLGEVDNWRDARLPRRFAGYDAPTVVGRDRRSEQCPDGRHLWDLIMSSGDYHSHDVDDSADVHVEGHLDVRLTGTCVRCGVIWRMEGTELDKSLGGPQRVDVMPLRAGDLRAQEVDRSTWYGSQDEARSTFSLHVGTDPAPVGWMGWATTLRGRRYYGGRLDSWPVGDSVEAPTAIACLRKIAKRGAR